MFTKGLTFQLTGPVTSDSFDSPAETIFFTSQTQTLITVLNVNKKFSQTGKFSRPWFSQNRRQNFGGGAAEKKNCRLLKHRFTILTNKILCSTLALYVSKHRCCNYRRRSTTKINRSRAVGNSHRTSLWTRRRKTNADSRLFMNKIICSILTRQVANIGIDIYIAASFKSWIHYGILETTSGFNIQIVNSIMQSCGVRFT